MNDKKKLLLLAVRTGMIVILCALVYLSQSDAAFYCEQYCEAKYGDFVQYSPGNCRCTSQPLFDYPFLNITATSGKVNTSFINLSQVQLVP